MLALLLMVATTVDDSPSLLTMAKGRLSPCAKGLCGEPVKRSRFRLSSGDAAPASDAKGRAMQATGAPCEVVGTRYCTRKPRTLFKTDFTD